MVTLATLEVLNIWVVWLTSSPQILTNLNTRNVLGYLSISFIFMLSSSPLKVWSLTFFTRLSLLYAFSSISHTSFEDLAFAIFLKTDSSATRYNMYKTVLSFTRDALIVVNQGGLSYVDFSCHSLHHSIASTMACC